MSDGNLIRHYRTTEDSESLLESEEDLLFDHYTLTATGGQKPLRVDKFLANLLPFTTRSRIKNASQTGSISVNGQAVKVSYKVKAGDVVKLMLPFPPPPKLEPEEIPLDIRYEDDDLLLVHKPVGMVCHPSLGHRSGTLVHGLLWHFAHLPAPAKPQEHPRPGLVHRIDRDTTGLMVVAKTEFAMAHLSKQFFDRTSDREYQAIVWGDLAEDQGTIEAHVGRHPSNRKIFHAYPDGKTGKHAITHYQVLERFGVATLVKCKLETGRTHQIRVHMKYLGHTLVGDADYGGDKPRIAAQNTRQKQFLKNALELMPRQALHAKTLAFDHPTTGKRMAFDSELPQDFQDLIAKLRTWPY